MLGVRCLVELDGSNLAMTNFSAAIGAHTLGSARSTGGELLMVPEGRACSGIHGTYEFFLGVGNSAFNFHSTFPGVTQTQYQSYKNPLFSLVTSASLSAGGPRSPVV